MFQVKLIRNLLIRSIRLKIRIEVYCIKSDNSPQKHPITFNVIVLQTAIKLSETKLQQRVT